MSKNSAPQEHHPAFRLRTTCRLCGSANLVKVVELPLTVPGEHLKGSPGDPDPVAIPIDFYQCEQCGHVQILHVPPLEVLYNREYSFMPGNNPDLVAHFRKTIEFFTKSFTRNVTFAFELGSNDGVFLDELRKVTGCRVLGMDPALPPAIVARERGVETLLEFFNLEQARKVAETYGHPDVVIANNVFAHNDDLRGMIEGIAAMLKPGGYFIFEASDLKAVVEKYLVGTIIHEHLSIHSLYSLKPCLAEFGLQLVGVRKVDDIQGGALIGVAQKGPPAPTPATVAEVIAAEQAAGVTSTKGLINFNRELSDKVAKLNAQIQEKFGDQKIIGYGAARSAPFIIDVLGMRGRISCVIDDNPVKKGKYLPVSAIPIVGSNEVPLNQGPPVFLILGWAQTKRIVSKLRQRFPNGYAVTVYPEFAIQSLSAEGS